MSDQILQEQIAYYQARAAEYDEWFYRTGRYDYGEALNTQWFDDVEVVRSALQSIGKVETALELACGTGIWTQELVQQADSVTAVDAAAEVLNITQSKLPDAKLRTVQADLFAWEPDQQYDLVFFGFWLSHVPPDKLDGFLGMVRRALKPNGRVFMVDSRRTETIEAKDRHLPKPESIYHVRKLNDGREFNIYKIYYQPDELEAHFARHGIRVGARFSDTFFVYASGQIG
jgi:demethylmenaquinone methyltransferase/2-methoxy-6-polyprenyl-1,4-benzoquinol methylase